MAMKRKEICGYYHQVSPFIDLELADRGDLAFWDLLARSSSPARVLEVGCGTGRVTAALSRVARRVVAFDLCHELMTRARSKLASAKNVYLVASDLRDLALSEKFDLIIAADDPFVHLTETSQRSRGLKRVAAHLGPGGRFILDALWLSPSDRRQARRREGLVRKHKVHSDRYALEVSEAWICSASEPVCQASYKYHRDHQLLVEATFQARFWTVAEVEILFQECQLEIRSVWGDYGFSPFDPSSSPRLVVEGNIREKAAI